MEKMDGNLSTALNERSKEVIFGAYVDTRTENFIRLKLNEQVSEYAETDPWQWLEIDEPDQKQNTCSIQISEPFIVEHQSITNSYMQTAEHLLIKSTVSDAVARVSQPLVVCKSTGIVNRKEIEVKTEVIRRGNESCKITL
jgi:hypothetical protein